MRVAITGATGFIGQRVARKLASQGHDLRLLVRRNVDFGDAEIIKGDLQDEKALSQLVDGVERVLHIAGKVQAVRQMDFQQANVGGTDLLTKFAAKSGCPMTILISSLAASKPAASNYAQSKFDAENRARSNLAEERLVTIRPPAVYGPGDAVTLPIFQQLCAGWLIVPSPPKARFSMIYVDDLVDLISGQIDSPSAGRTLEADDGKPGGYSWHDLAHAAEKLMNRKVRKIFVPKAAILLPAYCCDFLARLRGKPLPLSSDKLGELYQPKWVAEGTQDLPWQPKHSFLDGAKRTMAWYMERGWIKQQPIDPYMEA